MPRQNDALLEYVRAKGFLWFVFVYSGVFVAGSVMTVSVIWYLVSLWLNGPSAPQPGWVNSPLTTIFYVWLFCVGFGVVVWPLWFVWFRRMDKRRGA